MRRTRYVALPVRAWQYVGLLVVSLACLTLGLVSRDKEGRAGSLAGPELEHRAPHEVDACPNSTPFANLPSPLGLEQDRPRLSRTTRASGDSRIGLAETEGRRVFRGRSLDRVSRARTQARTVFGSADRSERRERNAGFEFSKRSLESMLDNRLQGRSRRSSVPETRASRSANDLGERRMIEGSNGRRESGRRLDESRGRSTERRERIERISGLNRDRGSLFRTARRGSEPRERTARVEGLGARMIERRERIAGSLRRSADDLDRGQRSGRLQREKREARVSGNLESFGKQRSERLALGERGRSSERRSAPIESRSREIEGNRSDRRLAEQRAKIMERRADRRLVEQDSDRRLKGQEERRTLERRTTDRRSLEQRTRASVEQRIDGRVREQRMDRRLVEQRIDRRASEQRMDRRTLEQRANRGSVEQRIDGRVREQRMDRRLMEQRTSDRKSLEQRTRASVEQRIDGRVREQRMDRRLVEQRIDRRAEERRMDRRSLEQGTSDRRSLEQRTRASVEQRNDGRVREQRTDRRLMEQRIDRRASEHRMDRRTLEQRANRASMEQRIDERVREKRTDRRLVEQRIDRRAEERRMDRRSMEQRTNRRASVEQRIDRRAKEQGTDRRTDRALVEQRTDRRLRKEEIAGRRIPEHRVNRKLADQRTERGTERRIVEERAEGRRATEARTERRILERDLIDLRSSGRRFDANRIRLQRYSPASSLRASEIRSTEKEARVSVDLGRSRGQSVRVDAGARDSRAIRERVTSSRLPTQRRSIGNADSARAGSPPETAFLPAMKAWSSPTFLKENDPIEYAATFDAIRQVLVIGLCTIYGLSLFPGKRSLISTLMTQAPRFIVW